MFSVLSLSALLLLNLPSSGYSFNLPEEIPNELSQNSNLEALVQEYFQEQLAASKITENSTKSSVTSINSACPTKLQGR